MFPGSNYTRNAFATDTIFDVFRAQRTCLVGWKCSPPGTNSAIQIPYLDLRGHFEAGGRAGSEGKEASGETADRNTFLVIRPRLGTQ